ncbi:MULTISPECIES: carboxymuconolactone decarboxylase family protein [unclassified Streptomyces]|uniref:carboxymuconolactone decarboxylase family protein n=1 Tax=unclassified Streptomyces TaxID=2593676 RepID=UPI00379C8B28
MPRIEPLPVRSWPPEMRAALASLTPPNPRHPAPVSEGRPKALNVLGTYAHHPELAHAFLTFNGHIMRATTLTPRQRELLVLRVSALRDCAYEWSQHVVQAGDVGLTAEEVHRIGLGPDEPGWDPQDAALLRAADELVVDGAIGEKTWGELGSTLGTQQLIDLIFTVGAYETIAYLMRSFALDLDDDLPTTAIPHAPRRPEEP